MTAKSAPETHLPVLLSSASILRLSLSWTSMKRQCWEFTPLCVSLPASRTPSVTSVGTCFWLNSRTSSLVFTASVASMSVPHAEFGLVLEYLVDPVEDPRLQGGDELERPDVLLDLFRSSGPCDHGGHVLVPPCPGE